MASLTMNDGRAIPTLGYGTWRVNDEDAQSLVAQAIGFGYRHIDTAAVYANEAGVGRGIADAGVDRAELFVTTKLWNADQADPRSALAASLTKLGLDYVDLYLIHWPVPAKNQYVGAWEQLVALREEGLAKSIGVSNFLPAHLAAVVATGTTPAVNQIEVHPSFANRDGVRANTGYGILTECYSPLGRARDLTEPVIGLISARLGASPAQVILAWHLAKNFVVIPKSITPARIRENWESLTLELSANDIAAIDALDADQRIGSDPAQFVGF